jgi:hypothetical protein
MARSPLPSCNLELPITSFCISFNDVIALLGWVFSAVVAGKYELKVSVEQEMRVAVFVS